MKKAMQLKEFKGWHTITPEGHKIKITLEPEENTADINITFSELFFIKAAMETLNVKDLQIIPSFNRS